MLINTIAEIHEFVAIGKDTEFSRIKPHIVSAESSFIKPILGTDLMDILQSAYTQLNLEPADNETLTEEQIALLSAQEKLIRAIKKALVYLAYWSGFQVLNATISDTGFKRTESATVKPLFKYQEDDLRNHFKINGFDALDQVLETLEENIGYFSDFKQTPNWTVRKAAFIPDTKTLNSIIYINNSRLTYLRMIPHTKLVEDIYLRPLLGNTLLERIKTEMVREEPDTEILKVIPYIQKPLAYMASALLMEESGADLTEKGLYFESSSAISNNDRNTSPADADRIAILVKRNRMFADSYFEMLKSYLIASASTFTDFAGTPGKVLRRDNNNKKTFWT